MTIKQLTERIRTTAEPIYGPGEAASIARLVALKRYGLSRADCALCPDAEVAGFHADEFDRLLCDLAASRPVQYILGTADFYGLELTVGEGVLIPRPETEELVRWMIDDTAENDFPTKDIHPNNLFSSKVRLCDALEKFAREHTDSYVAEQILRGKEAGSCFSRKIRILDVGTGSGAIAMALAKNLPGADITAVDISPEALAFARLNSDGTGAGVTLVEADVLDPQFDPGTFDAIVSNPPYIPTAQRTQMADNVAKYEPGAALFVPDSDPLVFYRAIARLARRSLSPQGALYFEIHEDLAREVAELLAAEGFHDVVVKDDINSKPRMVRCRL